MALKATIYKAELSVSDIERHHYATYMLTIAKHPSENDERMMIRLLAFAINASEDLAFCRGLSTDDEPDLWLKSRDGQIERWIDVGTPSVKRIRKACGRASAVQVITYQERSAETWWKQSAGELKRFSNLSVISVLDDAVHALAIMAQRSMQIQVTIQDAGCWVSDGSTTIDIKLRSRDY